MTGNENDRTVSLDIDGKIRRFDIDDPVLPSWVDEPTHGDHGPIEPDGDSIKRKDYEQQLEPLQVELVKVQAWLQETGNRVVALFEGRDAAGKGGAIGDIRAYMNPRHARIVALPKPSDIERGQWYFQRYAAHLPSAGEFVLFDRSWYNRAGVEPVMGFCTPEEHRHFLKEAPYFERMLVESGTYLFKFWLNITRKTQIKRFHDRRHSPLKVWKLSPMDIASMEKWDAYTAARDTMFAHTHTDVAPWTVINADDKRLARLNLIRKLLADLPYAGKDSTVIGTVDQRIVGQPQRAAGGQADQASAAG
jgi:polyphosphate kinase 2